MVSDQPDIKNKVQYDDHAQLAMDMYNQKDETIQKLTEIKEFSHKNQRGLVYDKDPDFYVTAEMENEHRCLISVNFELKKTQEAI